MTKRENAVEWLKAAFEAGNISKADVYNIYGDVKVSTGVLKGDKRVEERTLLKRRTF